MKNSREYILNTSFTLFLRKNFKEVTMNEIVRETGLSKGALYHYFTSKEQLFKEVIDSFFFKKMVIDFKKLRNDSLKNFYRHYAKEVKRIIMDLEKYLNSKNESVDINYFMMMFDAIKIFPGFRDKIKDTQKNELSAWTRMVRKARKGGEFTSPMSDEQIARFFVYSSDGITLNLLSNKSYETVDLQMIKLWDNFYKELKK